MLTVEEYIEALGRPSAVHRLIFAKPWEGAAIIGGIFIIMYSSIMGL